MTKIERIVQKLEDIDDMLRYPRLRDKSVSELKSEYETLAKMYVTMYEYVSFDMEAVEEYLKKF